MKNASLGKQFFESFPDLFTLPDANAVAPCALCGATDSPALPVKSLLKPTTGDIPDTFRGTEVCQYCAAVFAKSNFTGNILTVGDTGIRPMVALASATDERPAWTDIVRDLAENHYGKSSICIMSSNTKRRLWPRAEVSVIGAFWRILFVDGEVDRVLTVNLDALIGCLTLVEDIYTQGFNKRAIREGLLSDFKRVQAVGLEAAGAMEEALIRWRTSDEFIVSTFIAQTREAK